MSVCNRCGARYSGSRCEVCARHDARLKIEDAWRLLGAVQGIAVNGNAHLDLGGKADHVRVGNERKPADPGSIASYGIWNWGPRGLVVFCPGVEKFNHGDKVAVVIGAVRRKVTKIASDYDFSSPGGMDRVRRGSATGKILGKWDDGPSEESVTLPQL